MVSTLTLRQTNLCSGHLWFVDAVGGGQARCYSNDDGPGLDTEKVEVLASRLKSAENRLQHASALDLEIPMLQNFLTFLKRQCKSGEAFGGELDQPHFKLGQSKSTFSWKVQGLSHRKTTIPLQRLSQVPLSVARGVVSCVMKPCGKEGPCFSADMLVLLCLTGHIPSTPLQPEAWKHLSHLKLADPIYTNPGTKLEGPSGTPVALDSVFGWILMGRVNDAQPFKEVATFFVTSNPSDEALDAVVECLWKLEKLPDGKVACKPEENERETMLVETHVQLETGRHMDTLPFKTTDPNLGESHDLALRRFHLLERCFKWQPEVKTQYVAFMEDYLALDT
ncbi:hypothetical protein PR048_001141 [Dryococelus australis]|uniref:Peptidase aspartic putative domain-containing protein n=1 Tax=Dryococelus australis TaxID=614101 RepID=A0ABQ9IGJ4_9NEOP|nr:hypothetical protein PR048_001141 [Dryococelus australis]